VSTVGEVPTRSRCRSSLRQCLRPVPDRLRPAGIVFLALAESIGAARSWQPRGLCIDPDRSWWRWRLEPGGGALRWLPGRCEPVAVGDSESAGARTQLSSLVTSGLILATALILAPLFENLPNAVLAAIVMTSALSLIDVHELRRYYDWRPRTSCWR